MTLTITIQMDNAAFEPHPRREIARLLKLVADQMWIKSNLSTYSSVLMDINGNKVGKAEVES
jgi:hypothetical protein